MGKIRIDKNIIQTIFVKGGILLLNFAVTIFVARLWGAEGKGVVAIFAADLSLIAIFCNIFTSSSASYYLKRVGASALMTQAYLWVAIISGVLAIALSFYNKGVSLTLPLFIVSIFLGYITFHSSLFLGAQKVPYYNLLTFLQPLLLLVFMFVINYCDTSIVYYSYFYAQIISLVIVFIISKILMRKTFGRLKFILDKAVVKQSFLFGWQTELSSVFQLLNYRLSLYVLGIMMDMSVVGVFSIGMSVGEAIWVFSRSISLVQYSNVLKSGNTAEAKKETSRVALYALYASIACLAIIALLPKEFFSFIFKGEEFEYAKRCVLLMSPGILAIALTNVYGNYFSAIGCLKILILKSGAGLVATIILVLILIPRYGIDGACISNTISYIISSLILTIAFFSKGKDK